MPISAVRNTLIFRPFRTPNAFPDTLESVSGIQQLTETSKTKAILQFSPTEIGISRTQVVPSVLPERQTLRYIFPEPALEALTE